MSYSDYTAEEIESRGEAIFVKQIRDRLNTGHRGKFLAIDIETGSYKVDADDLVATKQLLAMRPNAVIYGLRIGFPTAYRIGTIDPPPKFTNAGYPGTRQVWLLKPETRMFHVYRSARQVDVLGTDDAFDGRDVLPGLRSPVQHLFPPDRPSR